jgi:hypothetical protein
MCIPILHSCAAPSASAKIRMTKYKLRETNTANEKILHGSPSQVAFIDPSGILVDGGFLPYGICLFRSEGIHVRFEIHSVFNLRQWLVRTSLVCLAVREKPVDDHSDDGEDEDDETPQQLVRRWAVGLQNLDYWGGTKLATANRE